MVKVEITLQSGFAAAEFYDAITKARGVLELSVKLDWPEQYTDFVKLKDMISKSNIRSIKVDLTRKTDRRWDFNIRGHRRYDPLVEIMRLPSIQSFEILNVYPDFFKNTQLAPKNTSLSTNLKHLGIYGKLESLVGADMAKLKSLVSLAPNLRSLSLQTNTRLSLALSMAFETNSSLITLDLGYNSVGGYGVQALSEALKINSTLTTLVLQYNLIGDNGAQALSEALKVNSTLITLVLRFNSIGDGGAQTLSEALKINSTLATLDLHGNSIGFNGVQELSEALKVNSALTTLVLQHNSIGDNGAQALSEALKVNSTLTTLDLGYNSVGGNGAQALSEALKVNSTLITLDLRFNSIGDNKVHAQSEVLKINSALTTLALPPESFDTFPLFCKANIGPFTK